MLTDLSQVLCRISILVKILAPTSSHYEMVDVADGWRTTPYKCTLISVVNLSLRWRYEVDQSRQDNKFELRNSPQAKAQAGACYFGLGLSPK